MNTNVFSYGYFPKRFRNIPHNIAQVFRNFKYAYQRATRGYCDYDLWDLDKYLESMLPQAMRAFADRTCSYPASEAYPTCDEWRKAVRETANLLADPDDKIENVDSELWKEIFAKCAEDRTEFFTRLAAILPDLWY